MSLVMIEPRQSSFSKDAAKVTTYADDYITRGKAFQIQKRFTLSSGASLYLELNTPLAAGKFVYSLPISISVYGGGCALDTYYADSSTGGSAITAINMNGFFAATTPLIVVKSGVTVTGTPVDVREYIAGSAGVAKSGGGDTTTGAAKILRTNKPLYFKLTNLETSSITVALGFVWYEI